MTIYNILWAEMVMGRNGHGPKCLWAEMTSDRFFASIQFFFLSILTRVSTKTSWINDKDKEWYMGDKVITESSKTEHLWILRSSKEENTINIQKRTSLARGTLYSLIKTGVHGCNGLNAKISYKIYQVYVIPRLLYGLEVLLPNKGQLDKLEKFHIEILKQIHITQTHPCNIQQYFTALKMFIFR